MFGPLEVTCNDQDRTMRLRSMIWFIYLAIEIINAEQIACNKGCEYFRNKLRQLS